MLVPDDFCFFLFATYYHVHYCEQSSSIVGTNFMCYLACATLATGITD